MDEFPDPARRDDNARQSPRIWNSEDLFGEENEVLILHGDEVYRLRRTRNERLILQK
ncbi:MAG: hemin uptake protein HemP [Planctomycetaceae bacterium]|nr:hemin uptake protein HemP [Planctomycetaceae bacterium]MBP62482.1 hemin uptake protein HemP [Planctomycetaceae bacterium]